MEKNQLYELVKKPSNFNKNLKKKINDLKEVIIENCQ